MRTARSNRPLALIAAYAVIVAAALLVVPRLATGDWLSFFPSLVGVGIAGACLRNSHQGNATWKKELLEQVIASALIGAVWLFVFSLPRAVLWFSPAWIVLSAAVRFGARVAATTHEFNPIVYLRRVAAGRPAGLIARAFRALGFLAPALAPFLVALVPVLLVYTILGIQTPGFAHPAHRTLLVGALVWALAWGVFAAWRPATLGSLHLVLLPLATAAFLLGVTRAFDASWLVWVGWSAALVLAYRAAALGRFNPQAARPGPEALRLLLVVGGAGWLMKGFLNRGIQGTGDALWYATMLADMVAQTRAHGFPVWSGQTTYQFNGAIYPLRVAPAFHHLGALLDLASGRTLTPISLQNLLIFLVGLGAALVTYFAAAVTLAERRWGAALLALLYLACPGVLGVAYNTDLYMSWMTVPFVPLAIFAVLRNFDAPRLPWTLFLAAALGLCWWGHSPIALWTTAGVALVQAWGLARRPPGRDGWIALGAGAVLFLAIAAYPVGSVLLYPPEPGVNAADFQRATAGNIAMFLRQVFPQVLEPVSWNGRALSDFQLGYTLWVLLLASVAWGRGRLGRAGRAVLAVAVGIAILLTPFPGWHDGWWAIVPAFFRNTTGNWVMNRLYVLLAAATVVAATTLIAAAPARMHRWVVAFLAVGCAWSFAEAGKFSPLSRKQLTAWTTATALLRSENVMVTRFAYLVFPSLPPTFSDGVVAPELEFRLLDRVSLRPLAVGREAAAAQARLLGTYDFTPDPGGDAWLVIGDRLRLEAGKHYLLALDPVPGAAAATGVIQVKGPSFFREYSLPAYGGDQAFGTGGEHSHFLPIWTSLPQGEEVRVIFVPQGMTVEQTNHFAQLRLEEYDATRLPVQVTGWTPYEAKVHAEIPAWLESPRAFQRGYAASVNGSPAEVRKSPFGLTMVAVPAGESEVVLQYVAPAGLRALFWISVLAILGALAAGTFRLVRPRAPLRV